VVQEDTKEVGLVALVDLRVERVDILHLSVPMHHLRGFLVRYIYSSRGTTTGISRAGKRTTGSGEGSAT
jgi:hypothetical protein